MDQTIALILGGGVGTRLFPLTQNRAKPAVPFASKYRLIDVPISNCINSGLYQMFVLTQYNSASLNNHVSRAYVFDRFHRGFITILAAEQRASSTNWYQGTADAVRQSLPHLSSCPHEEILILSGDQLYSMDYRQMLAQHRSSGAAITLAVTPVRREEAPSFGIVKSDSNWRIREFHEKPSAEELSGKESPVDSEMEQVGRVYLASMGIYIFNASVLWDLLKTNPDAHDFGKHILPRIVSEYSVYAYPFTGYWSDIGTIRSFFEANIMLAQPKPSFNLYAPEHPLYTALSVLPPAKITRSHIEHALIGEGSIVVDSHITDSVLGPCSYVGSGSRLYRTVLLGADYYPWQKPEERRSALHGPSSPGIGEGSYITNAIIDHNVSVGRGCVITNQSGIEEGEGPGFYIRDGIIVITKNTEIADGTVI